MGLFDFIWKMLASNLLHYYLLVVSNIFFKFGLKQKKDKKLYISVVANVFLHQMFCE